MKNLLSKLLIINILILSLVFFTSENAFAGGSFYLSPSSKTVPQGTTYSIAVRISSTDPINAVQANLSYPTDKLDFVGISTSGSAFDLQVENTGGGGQVKLARGLVGTVTGDKLIATVTFRAKVGSGSSSINFTAGTEAVDASGNPVVNATSGGTYTFAPPPAPSPPPDTTAPKITDVKVTETAFKGATIEWKTDEPASSLVEYGPNDKYGLSAEGGGATKDHKVGFSSELLIPGVLYHFRVKSADSAGNIATGEDGTFKTSGYTVQVKVVDQKGNPVEGVEVTLASEIQKAKTDKDGIATFKDVAPGEHLVLVESKSGLVSSMVEVKAATAEEIASGKIPPQGVEVKIIPPRTDPLVYVAALLAGLIVILLGVAAVWGWQEWKGRGKNTSSGPDNKQPEAALKPTKTEKPEQQEGQEKTQSPKNPPPPKPVLPRGESKIEVFRAD
ncbi:MAG: hypothetical protein A2113_03495 [Candidatus Woykebacteria bacterium GWA1_44_8]|uniref:Fibronectin type-III domain-containing protein n=1 Tax=Candidatus Woykebacteria bacterium GWA1_44_8 TaxID=1802591 RepID=A0A1G1W3A2_9BACT|nr:MAG: hypothetical protein A2113_03495 [Candidatus Woykebacteria bacterium GWA1_44_8]